MKKKAVLLVALLFVLSGCAGTGQSARTEAHKLLENVAVDWVDF